VDAVARRFVDAIGDGFVVAVLADEASKYSTTMYPT
jgi:hypothetical protein